ncbi:hypothetical protein [Prochlorococcus marinus]|uniref:hypothetical protein n=1 Tax=Prochlorococcus marinus TaxID=1219 RepID=UPI0022B41608|nr:hypothetical protein [Prochlorococcus marinus]
MNKEEIAAQKHIKELEEEFSDISIEIISAWDSWQYQKTIVEDLKNDRQDTKIAEEELIKKEEIYNNIEITNETRQQEIEREIKEINQKFPNLKEARQKEKEQLKKKAKEKSMKTSKIIASTVTLIITVASVYDLAKWRRYETFYDQNKIEVKERMRALGVKPNSLFFPKIFDKYPKRYPKEIVSIWPILATADRYDINLATPSLLHFDMLKDSCFRAAFVENISYLKISNEIKPKENDGTTITRAWGMSQCWWVEGTAPSLLGGNDNVLSHIISLPFIDLIPFFWSIVYTPKFWLLLIIILPLPFIYLLFD